MAALFCMIQLKTTWTHEWHSGRQIRSQILAAVSLLKICTADSGSRINCQLTGTLLQYSLSSRHNLRLHLLQRKPLSSPTSLRTLVLKIKKTKGNELQNHNNKQKTTNSKNVLLSCRWVTFLTLHPTVATQTSLKFYLNINASIARSTSPQPDQLHLIGIMNLSKDSKAPDELF